jgi:TolA-binding protein
MLIRTEYRSKRIAATLLVVLLTALPSWAESGGADAAAKPNSEATQPAANGASSSVGAASSTAPVSSLAAELEELRASVETQEQQFAEHSKELESERSVLTQELQRIAALEAKLGVVPAEPVSLLSPKVDSVVTQTPQDQKKTPINIISPEQPLSIKIGAAEFTPGGFVDLTGIFRSRDSGTGLGTNFQNVPYANSLPLGQLTELRFTGQGTRLSLKVDAKPTESTAVSGYYESDFNGYEPANSNVSTKNDSFRLRLAFAQVRHDKWELVTGQTWSLLTPTRVGLSPFPDNVFTALRLDTSYLAGLVFTRQPEVRVVYHATDHWSLGVAAENPQQFVPTSVVFPTDGSTNFFAQQFDNGSSSTNAASASTNPTVPNLHPDITAKTSFDWNVGEKLFHIDVGGVARSIKVYNNLATPEGTNTITGGGGQFNFNFEVFKNFHLIENAFYGDGVGRYIGGLGPDVVVKPTGELSGVHAGSGLAGFEWQTTPNFLMDGYASGAYFWRNYDLTTKALGTPCGVAGTDYCTGFGFVGSANTNNRDYQEATIGFIPTIWSSPNYGKLQFISQFSYVVRVPWYVAPGQPKNAHLFMTYLNLRYIIP